MLGGGAIWGILGLCPNEWINTTIKGVCSTCNPSTQEVDTGTVQVPGQLDTY